MHNSLSVLLASVEYAFHNLSLYDREEICEALKLLYKIESSMAKWRRLAFD